MYSFDHSWRLWDLETQTEVLHQVRASFPDSIHMCIRIRLCVGLYERCRKDIAEKCIMFPFILMGLLQDHGE